jgi:hypothetical protein
MLFEPILSIVDGAHGKSFVDCCQCRFSVQALILTDHFNLDAN